MRRPRKLELNGQTLEAGYDKDGHPVIFGVHCDIEELVGAGENAKLAPKNAKKIEVFFREFKEWADYCYGAGMKK